MKFNLACLLLISSVPALLIDDLNSLNTCGEKKPKDFPDRAFLPTGFNSYSVKLKFSDITCSGSVIDKNAILTAAHCCLDLSKMPTIYFAEFWNKGDPYYDSLRFKVNATNVIRHPEYGKYPTRFDACLVFLEHSIYDAMSANCSRSGCVEPVCLPESPVEAFTNYTAIASGFGWKTWIESKTLDHYSGSILEERICLLHVNMQKKKLHPENFCIGNLKTISKSGRLQVDSITLCDGFSGSPLVVNNGGYATLVGILSWGGRCGRYKKQHNPLVFQNVYGILAWLRSHLKSEIILEKITAPSEIDRISSAFSTHPNVGFNPTKMPSILNTTLPGSHTANASVTIVSSSSQTSTIYSSTSGDTETDTITSRKHLDSGYIDKSSVAKFESRSKEQINEIPSKLDLTFSAVTSATESTTESVQSLPEASSVDIDLDPGAHYNVIQKLRQHEIPTQTNSESFPKEFTGKFETTTSTLVFIEGRNFELSEAIDESLERETNIEIIVDREKENKNENSQSMTFDSSQMPTLMDSELSSSQGINLSSSREAPANTDEIQLSNFDSVQVYGDNFQVPAVVDPNISLFPDEYEDFYAPWSSDKGKHSSSFTEFDDRNSDEFYYDSELIEVHKDSDENSYAENVETEHLSDLPVKISVSQEKDRVSIYFLPDYEISYSKIVAEPPVEQTIPPKYPSTSTTSTTTKTTKTTATTTTTNINIFPKSSQIKSTITTMSTLAAKPRKTKTKSSIPTSSTITTSTTEKTTLTATTTTPEETASRTTLSKTKSTKKLTTPTSTRISSTSSTTSSTTASTMALTTSSTTTATTLLTTSSTTPSSTTSSTAYTSTSTTSSTRTSTTSLTTSSTTTATTSSKTSSTFTATTSKTTKSTSSSTSPSTTTSSMISKFISMMPTTSTILSSSSQKLISTIIETSSLREELKPAPLSTTSVLNVAVQENLKKTKLPVKNISSTIPPASSTLSSSSRKSSAKHRHKKHRKHHHKKKVSRKEKKQRKQEEAEIATPKNSAALTKSPLSRDFSSQQESTTSDAMHSTMPQIIDVDFYQEIIYVDEFEDDVSNKELPFVALFRNKAYIITSFVIIVLSVTLFGFFATRKKALCSSGSSSQNLATEKEYSRNSRSSYHINV